MQLGAQGTFPAVAHVIICHMPKQCVDHGCLQDGCICQSASQLAELFRVLSASNSVCTASVEAASSCSPLASNSLDKMAGKIRVQQWMQTANLHPNTCVIAGSVSMNPQGNTFIVSSQPRPQLGQAAMQGPPRVPTPQPPPLTEDDKKILNKPVSVVRLMLLNQG